MKQSEIKKSLQDIYETLKALSTEQRIKQYKLKPDRADVIVPTIGLSDGIIDSLYTQNMNKV